MGSVNKVILIGHLGRDAEIRFAQSGTPVANFSVATSERWTDRDGQKREQTEWHRVVLWGKMAESLQQYLVKGKQIYLEGKLQTREWENKEGQKVKTTEVRADRITLLGGGGGARSSEGDGEAGDQRRQERRPKQASAAAASEEPTDDFVDEDGAPKF